MSSVLFWEQVRALGAGAARQGCAQVQFQAYKSTDSSKENGGFLPRIESFPY